MSQQAVVDAIYTAFSGDTGAGGVSTLTGARIYNAIGPENVALPWLEFHLVTDVPQNFFSGQNLDSEFDVNVYGLRSAGSKVTRTIAERVYTLMHAVALTITGITGASTWCLDRGTTDPEEDAYRHLMRWRVIGTGV